MVLCGVYRPGGRGAPLEGAGAVYVYRGGAGATMSSHYSQRIGASNVPRAGARLTSFGHAFGRTPGLGDTTAGGGPKSKPPRFTDMVLMALN